MHSEPDCDSDIFSQHSICLWSTCRLKMSQLLLGWLEDAGTNSGTQQNPVGTFIIKVATLALLTVGYPLESSEI